VLAFTAPGATLFPQYIGDVGFQAWKGGAPAKPIADDPAKQCFACHMPQKANDYVFSTYLQ
jgi:hypothetical protein